MKKGLLIVLLIVSSFFACQTGCKDQFDLKNYVSYYQSNVYVGDYNGIKITAYYGQSEQPYKSDGIKGDPVVEFKDFPTLQKAE